MVRRTKSYLFIWKAFSITGLFFLVCALARAQQVSTVPVSQVSIAPAGSDRLFGFEPREKATWGTQHYFSDESELRIDLPQGFNAKGSFSFYYSDTSSRTTTIYLGAGKDWDQASLGFTYSITPLANNYRAHAFDFYGSLNSASKDFRTTVGSDLNITYNDQFVPIANQPTFVPIANQPTKEFKIKETMATLNLGQQIHDTQLSASYGKATYDQEITLIGNKVRPQSARFISGLLGVLQGFPDMTWKLGLSQDLRSMPIVLRTEYAHTRLFIPGQSAHGNSDSYLAGTDIKLLSVATVGLEYTHLTQTGQPQSNYFGAELRLRL